MDRYMNELIDSKAWNFEDKGSGKRLPSWATKIRLNFLMDNEANDWPDKPNWIYIYMNEKNLIAKPETLKTKAAEKDILLGQPKSASILLAAQECDQREMLSVAGAN